MSLFRMRVAKLTLTALVLAVAVVFALQPQEPPVWVFRVQFGLKDAKQTDGSGARRARFIPRSSVSAKRSWSERSRYFSRAYRSSAMMHARPSFRRRHGQVSPVPQRLHDGNDTVPSRRPARLRRPRRVQDNRC